jgi:hypothetical protein
MGFLELMVKPPYVFFLVLGLLMLTAGMILRLASGAVTSVTDGVKAGFAILFLYTVVICSLGADSFMDVFVTALPFIGQVADAKDIIVFIRTDFFSFMEEAARMIILAFIVNLLERLTENLIKSIKSTPLGKFLIWYLIQCLIVTSALFINWVIVIFIKKNVPPSVYRWIPVILVVVLAILILVTLLKPILTVLAITVNPVIGALAAFFFNHFIGRALAGAFCTTAILTLVVAVAQKQGWFLPVINGSLAISVFAPTVLMLFILWYIVWSFL